MTMRMFLSLGSALISLERFAAVLLRHVQIEQDEAGPRRGGGVCIFAAAFQVIEQLDPVFDETQIVDQLAFFESLLRHQTIVGVVVCHQDGNWFDPDFPFALFPLILP